MIFIEDIKKVSDIAGPVRRQALFDRMYRGLASQGFRRSLDNEGRCAYRGRDGSRCAIGHIIDDQTAEDYEGFAVGHMCQEKVFMRTDLFFLAETQRAHDYSSTPEQMVARLASVAAQFGLQVPVLEEGQRS